MNKDSNHDGKFLNVASMDWSAKGISLPRESAY